MHERQDCRPLGGPEVAGEAAAKESHGTAKAGAQCESGGATNLRRPVLLNLKQALRQRVAAVNGSEVWPGPATGVGDGAQAGRD